MVTKRTGPRKAAKPVQPRKRKEEQSLDPTLWADIAKIFDSVPEAEWAGVPNDASERFDELLEQEGLE